MVASATSSAREDTYIVDDSHRITRADSSLVPNDDGWSAGAGLFLKAKTSAQDAAEQIEMLTGYRPPAPGACGHYEVGPLDAKDLGPKDFWLSLIAPHVKIVRLRERQDSRPDVVANMWLGDKALDFDIDRATRRVMIDKFPFKFGFLPNADQELREVDKEVGPIRGRMSINEALRIFIGSDDLMVRWLYEEELDPPYTVSVVPLHREVLYADMSESECNFGYKELGRVTVTESRLPSLQDHVASAVEVIDRERIERSGATSVPDLLRAMPQTAFHRGLGYRASGAQFAELRGLGAQYAKVLINGKPTFGSAAEVTENAFDLNAVPLSAVERIEISPHGASLVYGADAIGGMVNIVLREADRQLADVRYEGADGGAGVTRGAVVAGVRSDTALGSIVLDYSHTNRLLGRERSRWANQDFRRYGSIDNRSLASAPPNVSTLDGSNLPGLSSPIAAVSMADAGVPTFRGGEVNLTSLMAWQSIVPEIRRMSISAIGQQEIGSSTFRTEFLLADRSSSFQSGPEVAPEVVLAADHPQNSFGVPIAVSAALTGLPPQMQPVQSRLLRGVVQASGDIAKWKYEAYAVHSSERSKVSLANLVDPVLLMQALSEQASNPLGIISSRPGEGGRNILAPTQSSHYYNGGTQITSRIRGNLISLPAGSAMLDAGIDVKREFAEYENVTDKVSRDVISGFAIAEFSSAGNLKASFGIRRDDYDDLSPVTSYQYSATWKPTRALEVRAAYNDAFLAPAFIDLYFPRLALPTEIFDLPRNELASATFVTGGNRNLRPTVGRSSSIGLVFRGESGLRSSVDLWHMSLRDRIALVLPPTLLANSAAFPDRVLRDPQTPEDIAAGRPGRLRTLDITRANFGTTDTRGIDLAIESTFRGAYGSVQPRLDITYTDRFRFNDLPGREAPATDRAGIANVFGTITQWRLRGSLSYDHDAWKANVLARHDVCYDDFNSTLGSETGRSVCPSLVIDVNVSREVGEHVIVTIGGNDILDRSPPFSEVNGPAGFDMSQGDLVGRRVYLSVSALL